MVRPSAFLLLLALSPPTATASPADAAQDPEYGVYLRLVEGLEGSVQATTDALTASLRESGWQLLAVRDMPGPDGCSFESRVLILHSDGYAAALAPYGSHAAFAVPLRVAVFEDESGVHVGALDPRSLNRTIVDEQVPGGAWDPWLDRLKAAVQAPFPDHSVEASYGQFRTEGRIARTFGIMAGGPFVEKLEVAASVPAAGTSVSAVATRLEDAFGGGAEGEWRLEAVYRIDLPGMESVVLGVSGAPMEARAFEIVGHGGDDARKEMACPGLDHGPAFPIELVVRRVADAVEVVLVDEMFRMKMFFEDAGKVAFAKNMGMPGSIEDELRAVVEMALGS